MQAEERVSTHVSMGVILAGLISCDLLADVGGRRGGVTRWKDLGRVMAMAKDR